MASNTRIEWTSATWNAIRGCSMAKGSETGGCLRCYAARLNARNLPELRSPSTGKPFARILASGPRWTGDVEPIRSQLFLPFQWTKPKRIFVNSMSDLFHESLPDDTIDMLFAVMALNPRHTFQCLTKRDERMREYFEEDPWELIERWGGAAGNLLDGDWIWHQGKRHRKTIDHFIDTAYGFEDDGETQTSEEIPFPLPNVWLGVSTEDQKTADKRILNLLKTPAAVRWVSAEPLLAPLDLTQYLNAEWYDSEPKGSRAIGGEPYRCARVRAALDWVVSGGESGPGARPADLYWFRSLRDQCKTSGIPYFMKQLGGVTDKRHTEETIPADLFVREFPCSDPR